MTPLDHPHGTWWKPTARDLRIHLRDHHHADLTGLDFATLDAVHTKAHLGEPAVVSSSSTRSRSTATKPVATPCPGPWCRNTLPPYDPSRVGRPQTYCSENCRKAAHRARKAEQQRQADAEAARLAAIADRQDRLDLAAHLVDAITAVPRDAAAAALADWMARQHYRQEQLHMLAIFLDRHGAQLQL